MRRVKDRVRRGRMGGGALAWAGVFWLALAAQAAAQQAAPEGGGQPFRTLPLKEGTATAVQPAKPSIPKAGNKVMQAHPEQGGDDARPADDAKDAGAAVLEAQKAGARALAILRLAAGGNQEAINYLKQVIAHGEAAMKAGASPAQPDGGDD